MPRHLAAEEVRRRVREHEDQAEQRMPQRVGLAELAGAKKHSNPPLRWEPNTAASAEVPNDGTRSVQKSRPTATAWTKEVRPRRKGTENAGTSSKSDSCTSTIAAFGAQPSTRTSGQSGPLCSCVDAPPLASSAKNGASAVASPLE